MWHFALKRLLALLPQLLVISLLAFLIMKAAPGGPIGSLVGGREYMTDADYERVAYNLGLDRPLIVQYGAWLGQLLKGDLGHSLRDGREISVILWAGIQATLVLVGVSWLVLLVVAIAAGYWAGTRAHTKIDYAVSAVALVSFATPAFWLGLILILVFSVNLDLLPSSGQSSLGRDNDLLDYLRHLVLPVTCIVLTHAGPYIRFVRGSVRDVLSAEYFKAARARGLSRATLAWRYILPNALTPFITWMGLSVPLLVGGTFIVEWVFGWPGIGRIFLQAAISRDYNLLMATVLVTGLFVIIGNLISDMLVAWLNPTLRRI